MRRAVALLVLVVVTAGCGGQAPTASDQSTNATAVTPAAVPQTPEQPTVAPGLTDVSIASLDTLVAAHASVLDGQSYTAHRTRTVTTNGSVRFHRSSRSYVGPDGTRFYRVAGATSVADDVRAGVPGVEHVQWNGEYGLRMRVENGTRTFERLPTRPSDESVADRLRDDLRSVESVRVDRVGGDGRFERYRVVGTEFRSTGPNETTAFSALVDERGFVRQYNLTMAVGSGDEAYQRRERVTVTRLGSTTLPGPPWLETARNATAPAGT